LKTQELYVLVFVTRYVDLFWNHISLYNSIMKVIFIATTVATVYLMRIKYKHTYDKEHDTFRVLFLIVPSAVLALIFHYDLSIYELLWSFSIYLEAVAILPQLLLVQRTGEVETMNATYIVSLGSYRALYILNWIWRLIVEPGYRNWIGWVSGIVQTGLYADFFYYYFLSKWYGRKLQLPS
jgi:ER lumen protein retaining receptor